MIPAEPPNAFLAQIAAQSAATWHAVGGRMFQGEATVETGNRVYRFQDGIFVSRTAGPKRPLSLREDGPPAADPGALEAPASMTGMRLIGFLFEEGGLWSLSTRWRAGSHAVLWRPGEANEASEAMDPKSFTLTSATVSFALEDPEPKPQPWLGRTQGSQSGVRARRPARPPSIVRPSPPSMTRLHAGPRLPTVIIT